MISWHLILFGLIIGILASGIILLVSRPSRGKPVQLPPAPSQPPIAVDVSGAVHNLGVYYLDHGSRVEDAILAAGGFLPEAFSETINLASPLSEGNKVLIPILRENTSPSVTSLDVQSPVADQSIFPISINTASKETLMELPVIGETKAQEIINYRNQHGCLPNWNKFRKSVELVQQLLKN